MTRPESELLRIARLKRLERTDTMRARIDRQANAATSWNMPPARVLADWHLDQDGNLCRAVGRE